MKDSLEALDLGDEGEMEVLDRWIKNVDDAMNPEDWMKALEGKEEFDA